MSEWLNRDMYLRGEMGRCKIVDHTVSRCSLTVPPLRRCRTHHWGYRELSKCAGLHWGSCSSSGFMSTWHWGAHEYYWYESLEYVYNLVIFVRITVIGELVQVVSSSIFNYDTTLLKGLLLYFKRLKVFCRILMLPWEHSLNFFDLEQFEPLKLLSIVKK